VRDADSGRSPAAVVAHFLSLAHPIRRVEVLRRVRAPWLDVLGKGLLFAVGRTDSIRRRRSGEPGLLPNVRVRPRRRHRPNAPRRSRPRRSLGPARGRHAGALPRVRVGEAVCARRMAAAARSVHARRRDALRPGARGARSQALASDPSLHGPAPSPRRRAARRQRSFAGSFDGYRGPGCLDTRLAFRLEMAGPTGAMGPRP
jgi:hypothetical protein